MKRNTIQRTLVLEAVNHLRVTRYRRRGIRCHRSAAPPYQQGHGLRNLNQLAEDGEIQKLEMPDGPDCFDHRLHRHYHAKCSRCGRVFDIEMDYMEDLAHRVKDTYGFAIDGHNLVFTGICPTCQQNGTQPGPSK